MHKSATKYNKTLGKWCKNKHGASKIMDTLETYQYLPLGVPNGLYLQAIKQFSGTVAGEKEDFCKGTLACTIFTLFLFCFNLFLLASFYQKYKKIVSFIVAFIYLP
jgi:hypothetical protein